MDTRDPPSLLNKIFGPLVFIIGGLSALTWFFYRIIVQIQSISSPIILFDKGSYYMLGVGVGLLSLGIVVAIEFWGGSPTTDKQTAILSRLAISGVVLMFALPHISHFAADSYLKKNGYSVCQEASHQWLFVRDIVYIQSTVECNADIKTLSISLDSISDYAIDPAIWS